MAADLTTTYLGLSLSSPIVASASPLTGEADTARRIADAGAAAIVMPSLFEEEILREEVGLNRSLEAGSEHFAEALDYFPGVDAIATAGDRYVAKVADLKAAVAVPVIASLNATSTGGWTRYASLLADAGADAIELNLYHVAADPDRSAADVEDEKLAVIAAVRGAIGIPLAVKLSPFFSSTAHFARRAVEAGADGLVLFNRFYQPDVDLDALDVVPRLELSSPWELRLPLRWIAILRPRLGETSLGATSGISTGIDAAKAIAVGADVAMMTSAILRQGPGHVTTVVAELQQWLDEHDYESVAQLRGSMSHATSADPAAFERANYHKVLHSWTAPSWS
ncbi:MAG: dihydroorotate dehydrogenase-like protein [Acidimicrobiales bacterium]